MPLNFVPRDGSTLRSAQQQAPPLAAGGHSGSKSDQVIRSADDNADIASATNVCLRWLNSKMKCNGYDRFEKLVDAFQDGVGIAKVLEILSGERVRVRRNAKLAAIRLDNLTIVFNAIDKIGIDTGGNIFAKDFYDGNMKLIVAFCFKLILKYDMPRSGKMILKWMHRRVTPFGYKVDVDDPVPDVASGKEFLALITSQRPDYCDAANLDGSDPIGNLRKAFEYLETEFGVDQLLEPEDVAKQDIGEMELVMYLTKVKEAFDAEQPDIEPESLSFPGSPFEFTVGIEVPKMEEGQTESPLLPVLEPEEVENLAYTVEPELPAGLTMHPETGVIEGIPEIASSLTHTVTATNSAGEVTCEIVVTVRDVEPTGLAYEGDNFKGTVGENVSISAPAVEPAGCPVKFSVDRALPPGLVLDEMTGCIFGVPELDAVGSETYKVKASNTGGETETDITINITDVPPTSLEYGDQVLTVGEKYNIAGVLEPKEAGHLKFVVSSAPGAMSFDENTGVFSGSPSQEDVGTMEYTVVVMNSGGSIEAKVKITVNEVCPTGMSFDGDALEAVVGVGIKKGGNPPTIKPAGTPVTFSIGPDPLPEGLELDTSTGAITGVPTVVPDWVSPDQTSKSYVVTASNTGGTCTADLEIVILEIPPTEVKYPDILAPMGKPISISPEITFAAEGDASVKFSCEGGLPDGLELDATTGTISGTVTNPELYQTSHDVVIKCGNTGGECETTVHIDIKDDSREFFEHVDKNEEAYIQRLAEVVGIPSISSLPEYRDDVVKAVQWYKSQAESLGGDVKVVDTDGDLPPVLQITFGNDDTKPTVCSYGYLDVQPVDGKNWKTDPFQLTNIDGKMYGRGTSSNKGPVCSWLCVVEAYKQLGRELPVNLKIVVEGMMETGSEGCEQVVVSEAQSGSFFNDVDVVCISANSWLGKTKPCVTYGLRGVCYFTAEVVSGEQDLHSGVFGGTVHEAMTDVAILMTKLIDRKNKILIPGIYDNVDKFQDREKEAYKGIDFSLDEYGEDIGLKSRDTLVHDKETDSLMSRWREPSLSMHGIEGAFGEPGEKSVIPCKACLKFSISLVPSMDHRRVAKLVEEYLEKEFDSLKTGNSLTVKMHHGCRAWLEDFDNKNYECAKAACKKVYDVDPDLTREGASVPITLTLAEATQKSVCMIPLGACDDGPASSSEKYNVSSYLNGIKTLGSYLDEVGEQYKK